MSLYAVASYSTNKGSSLFEQSCEDLGADFFDQFLAFDPIDNESSDYPALPESTLLAKSSRENNIGATASSLLSEKPAVSHHSRHTSAPGDYFYTESSGRAAISDSELLSLENISLGSPISPLSPAIRANSLPSRTSTPHPTASIITRRRGRNGEGHSKGFKKVHNSDKSLRSPIRKSTHSSKMVRRSENFQNSLDVWGNISNSKFRFDFEGPVDPSTPPQTATLSDASESSSAGFMKESHDHVFDFSDGMPQRINSRPTEYDTPLATPVLDGHHSRKTSGHQPFSDSMDFPGTPQFHQSSGSWSQIPGSSELNSFGAQPIHTPDVDAPLWWNHAATAPMAQPSPTAVHINPQRATKSLAYQLQSEVSYESNVLPSSKAPSGLMIQMPETPSQQSFVVQSPHMQSPHMLQQGYFGNPQSHQSRHHYPAPPCPYVPETASHPHQQHHLRKTRSSARHQSESPSPKTQSPDFHIRKRKTKGSKEKKTPSPGTADFVNFTPSDSRKILTGVAPSGSSKTRARREKEATEKRRKLSLAALRAVRAAGGDVDSLVEQGLFA